VSNLDSQVLDQQSPFQIAPKRQNYINPPQNTLVPPQPSDPHRYSKLSTNSTQMGHTDIGEETSRNQVNETRTIKEKLSP
jgi:hypothetical protein